MSLIPERIASWEVGSQQRSLKFEVAALRRVHHDYNPAAECQRSSRCPFIPCTDRMTDLQATALRILCKTEYQNRTWVKTRGMIAKQSSSYLFFYQECLPRLIIESSKRAESQWALEKLEVNLIFMMPWHATPPETSSQRHFLSI